MSGAPSNPAAPNSSSVSPPHFHLLHVGLVTLRQIKLFLLNLALFDSWSCGSFPAAGSPDLLDWSLGRWKCSALTSTCTTDVIIRTRHGFCRAVTPRCWWPS